MKKFSTHYGSNKIIKNGSCNGIQCYKCKSCQKYFSDKARKFSDQQKAKAIEMCT